MPKSKQYKYSEVNGEEEVSWLDHNSLETRQSRTLPGTRSKSSWILYAIVVATAVLCGGVIGFNLQRSLTHHNNAFEDTSPLNIYDGTNFELHMQRFNGSFFRRSSYSGPPTPQMDDTWGRFTEAGSKWMPDYPPVLNVSTDVTVSSPRPD